MDNLASRADGEPQDPLLTDLFAPRPLHQALREFKKLYIIEVLKDSGGIQREAAKKLQIQATYLSRLIKELSKEIQ